MRAPVSNTQTPGEPGDERADGAWRALAAVLAGSLLFAAVVMALQAFDLADLPLEDEATRPGQEFYDGSGTKRGIVVALFGASAIAAATAAFISIWIAATGRFNRFAMPLTGVAIALGAAGIVLNNV